MFFLSYLSCLCHIVACVTDVPGLDAAADCVGEIAQIFWCSVRSAERRAVLYPKPYMSPGSAATPPIGPRLRETERPGSGRGRASPQVCACMLTLAHRRCAGGERSLLIAAKADR